MSLLSHKRKSDKVSFPRVSGDEPRPHQCHHLVGAFSPRERG